jgi:hypothetical protein
METVADDMVSRVARALATAWAKRPNTDVRDIFDVLARAAISAMREPTQHMVDVGDMEQCEQTTGEQVAMSSAVPWRVMVDAALQQK